MPSLLIFIYLIASQQALALPSEKNIGLLNSSANLFSSARDVWVSCKP